MLIDRWRWQLTRLFAKREWIRLPGRRFTIGCVIARGRRHTV